MDPNLGLPEFFKATVCSVCVCVCVCVGWGGGGGKRFVSSISEVNRCCGTGQGSLLRVAGTEADAGKQVTGVACVDYIGFFKSRSGIDPVFY